MDYKQFGEMKSWSASGIKTARNRQSKEDHIWVFLNFKLIGKYRSKSEADASISILLKTAPADLSEFEAYLMIG